MYYQEQDHHGTMFQEPYFQNTFTIQFSIIILSVVVRF